MAGLVPAIHAFYAFNRRPEGYQNEKALLLEHRIVRLNREGFPGDSVCDSFPGASFSSWFRSRRGRPAFAARAASRVTAQCAIPLAPGGYWGDRIRWPEAFFLKR